MRPPKLLSIGVFLALVACLILLIALPKPAERIHESTSGTAEKQQDLVPASRPSGNISPDPVGKVTRTHKREKTGSQYDWIQNPERGNGPRVRQEVDGRSVEFVGTHILAKLAKGATEEKLTEWLQQETTGRIINNQYGLLKIAPAKISLESLIRLKTALDKAPANLLAYAEPDYLYQIMNIPNDSGLEEAGAWYYEAIGAYEAWDIRTDASDIVVAVLDTGVSYNHEELTDNIWQGPDSVGYDWVNIDSDPTDDNGHGTAVAGIIGARANNEKGMAGLVWSVQIMPVKVLDDDGYGTSSEIASGIYWALNNGADILNLSLGGPESAVLEEAVMEADRQEVIMVCSAGNYGNVMEFAPEYPAGFEYPHVVQVGASREDGYKASFSNFSPEIVDIFAPGEDIEIMEAWSSAGTVGTKSEDGTSFAAPIVTGALALVMQQFPNEPASSVIQRVLDAAVFHDGLNGLSKRGTVVNIKRALIGYRPKAPTVDWEENPVSRNYGENFTIRPVISSDGPAALSWQFNDTQFSNPHRDDLPFYPLDPEDTGTYSVTVTTAYGNATSPPLVVSGIPTPPQVTYLTPSFSTLMGNTVFLRVSVDSGTPRPVVIDWYKVETEEPLQENTSYIEFVANQSGSYYAHIRSPYGEFITEPIEVSVVTLDWLDNLEQADFAYNEPLGTLMESAFALNPVYWTTAAPTNSNIIFESATGVYYFLPDGGRIERVDPQGNLHTSEPLPFSGFNKLQVVGGYVTFPKYFDFREVLSPDLEILPGSRGGMKLMAIEELDGWFYELFHDETTGKVGFRRTTDFYNFEMLIDEIPNASDHYFSYTLELANGVACLGTHSRHLWHPGTGLDEEEIKGQVWAHKGDMYRITRPDGFDLVYKYDPVERAWNYFSPAENEDLLKLGYLKPSRDRESFREIYDGDKWTPVWTLNSIDISLKVPLASTDSSFYYVTGQTGLSGRLHRSIDGFVWQDTGYDIKNKELHATIGDSIVFIEDMEGMWIDETSKTRKSLIFQNQSPAFAWTSIKTVGGIYFLWGATSYQNGQVFISQDLLHWNLTDLPFPPVQLDQLDDGTFEALLSLQGTSRIFSSADLVNWQGGESFPSASNNRLIEFSLGIILGSEYSQDGGNWVQLPFSVSDIIETQNRIFILNGNNDLQYTDKTDVLGPPIAQNVPRPHLGYYSNLFLGETTQLEIQLGTILPTPVTGVDFYINDEWIGHSDSLPVALEYTPMSYQYQWLQCTVDYDGENIRQFTLGRVDRLPRSSPLHAEWDDGWIRLKDGKIFSSLDKVDWSTYTGGTAPSWSAVDLMVISDKWLMRTGGMTNDLAVSEDAGKSWSIVDDPYADKIYIVAENSVAISSYNGGAYSINLTDWYPLTEISDNDPEVVLESGFLFYKNASGGIVRLEMASGNTTVIAQGPVTIGQEAYIKRGLGENFWKIYSLPDNSLIGEMPFNQSSFLQPHLLELVAVKDGYWIIQKGYDRYSGWASSGEFLEEEVNYHINTVPSRESADIGPGGLKILEIHELEWRFEEAPFTHVNFEIFNADFIPLSKDEGIRVRLEWMNPGNGKTLHTSEEVLSRFIPNESGTTLAVNFPAPYFTEDMVLDARMTLLPDAAGKVHGQYSVNLYDIEIAATARLNISLSGSGRLTFSEQGPFSVGTTVLATAVAEESFSFGQWLEPAASIQKSQTITLSAENNFEVVFLPHSVAAINRHARKSFGWLPEWYATAYGPNIYHTDTGWAHSTPTGWLITSEKEGFLYSWSPLFGWTCTKTDWFPYHWSYKTGEWIFFEGI